MIIKLCILRYYEMFDEVQERSIAPRALIKRINVALSGPSCPLGLPTKRLSALSHGSSNRDSRGFDDDESIDDTVLVMPVGSTSGAPPSTWGSIAGRTSSQAWSAHTSGTIRGKGSVTIGRGTARKASGASVQALGVTASGFFAPLPEAEVGHFWIRVLIYSLIC